MGSGKRLIDQIPGRESPTKVELLVLSAPRTGSTSIVVALRELGYSVYSAMHYSFSVKNHFPLWSEAVDAKYFGKGCHPYRAADFDKLVGDHQVVRGLEPSCFPDELLEAYPDAKVVYSTRNPDEWIDSMNRTVYRFLGWKTWPCLLFFERGITRDFYCNARRCFSAWTDDDMWNREKLRRFYVSRNERIRSLVSPERLLNFHPEDGWEPLCEFLDKEVPVSSYPHSMGTKDFFTELGQLWWATLRRATQNIVLWIGVGILPILLAYWLRSEYY